MRFLILVITFIYSLIFSSIEINAQVVKKVTDKSFVKEDKLIVKPTSSPTVDSIVLEDHDHNKLNEVVVKSQAPLVKFTTNGNTEVTVANTLLSTSSSVNELLSRVPNVTVAEGQISVLGKGEAIIYLNGILINYERFAAIPVSQIQKIEVISNPSSRYDAEGKAVINIITKKKLKTDCLERPISM